MIQIMVGWSKSKTTIAMMVGLYVMALLILGYLYLEEVSLSQLWPYLAGAALINSELVIWATRWKIASEQAKIKLEAQQKWLEKRVSDAESVAIDQIRQERENSCKAQNGWQALMDDSDQKAKAAEEALKERIQQEGIRASEARDGFQRALQEREAKILALESRVLQVNATAKFVVASRKWLDATKTKKHNKVGSVVQDAAYWMEKLKVIAQQRWPKVAWSDAELEEVVVQAANADLIDWNRLVVGEFGLYEAVV